MKKLIVSFFCFLTSLVAYADVTIDNITYELDDTNKEAKVKTALNGVAFTDNKVTIPETITNEGVTYTVTGVEAFSNTGGKMEMVLPKTVTYIKYVTSGITTLHVPAGVTSISYMDRSADLMNYQVDASNETFCDIDGVLFSKDKKTLVTMPYGRNSQANWSYTVPNGTKQIEGWAFVAMDNLATIQFPEGLETIGESAFEGCKGLLSFSLPTGLKTIGQGAFYSCTGIQTMIFPEGMEEIGQSAFDLCTSLTTVKFGEGLKTIKTYAFASCYALTYVEFANSIETIEDRAFWRTILNKVVLPENLQTIGWQAFVWANGSDVDYWKHLQSITIPANVTKIGECAFGGYCYDNGNNYVAERFSVDTIYVHMAPYVIPWNAFGNRSANTLVVPKGMRDIYSTTDGWRDSPNVIEGDWEPEYDKSPFVIGNTAIDEGMTIYQDGITYKLYAKEGRQAHLYSDLTDYPDDVINLPEEIYFRGNSYKVTGVEMFKSNRVLDLVLPNTVTSIQSIKSGVKTLNVPAGVTSITDMHESVDLQDFKVDAGNIAYCDVDGVLFSKDKKTLVYMPYGRNVRANLSYEIPSGTEQVGDHAFFNMTNLSTLKFPDGVKTIGAEAFNTCSGLLSFSLPTGIKTIGQGAFYSCTGIQTMIFPEGMEEIGASAFDLCTSLTTVKFGEGLKTIKTYAFASCYALTYVEFANSIETIEDRAFWRTILNKVVLPENLQTIGWQAFVWANGSDVDYWKHLQSITIPANVTKIGECAFGGYCYDNGNNYVAERFSVDTIYVHMAPYVIPWNAFGNRSANTLVVPKGMRDIYSTTDGWRDSPNVIEGDWEPEYDKSPFVIGNTAIDEGMTIYQDGITYKLYAKEGRQAHLYSDLTDYPDDVINLPEEIYFRGNSYKVTGVEMFKSNRVLDLVLPNTVTSIQTIKSGVKTLNVPAAVTSISDMHESVDLQDFKIDDGNTAYCDVDGVLFSKDKKTLLYMPYGRRSQENMSIKIADGVETIGSYAFYMMANITRLQTNAELREIKNSAFQGCTSISSLTLAEGLKTIGAYNFAGCTGLGRLTFPKGLEEIGNNAFDGCTNLTKITFGEGLKSIRAYAFASCYALTNVEFANSIETIEDRAFWRTILNKVVLPENLQTIGWQAFVWANGSDVDYWKHLQSITVPANITKIGECAFGGYCYDNGNNYVAERFSVDTVYTCIMEPMHINSNAFGTIGNTVLVVPTGTKADYLLFDGWKDFGDRIEESDALLPSAFKCEAPKFSHHGDTLTITSDTEGGVIYYTLDGKDPDEESDRYEKPIVLTENCTVKAYTFKEGLQSSTVASYKVNWFRVADVEIKLVDMKVEMSTETKGATIRYTLDGTDPTEESTAYQGMPLAIADNCTIKAIGMKRNYNNSHITTFELDFSPYTCFSPTFRKSGNQLTIETATPDAKIYYTLNNTKPTENSTLFEGPITITENCIVRAVAIKEGFFDSAISEYLVDWFVVADVAISLVNLQVEMHTETEGAVIRYTLDGSDPTEQSIIYQGQPLTVEDGTTVKAIAMKQGFKSSNITTFVVNFSAVTCNAPSFRMSGKQLVIETSTMGADIYYTLDDTEPTRQSNRYEGPITLTENCVVRAVVIKEGYRNSTVNTYNVDWFTVDKVEFELVNLQLRMWTATEGATIRYTLDGSEPTEQSFVYQGQPLSVEDGTIVKAMGTKSHFHNSEVTTYMVSLSAVTCSAPIFRISGKQLVIETSTVGGTIYYTLDETEPTKQSLIYEGPITMTHNCVVKAVVMKDGYRNSEVRTFEVSLFEVAEPTFVWNDGKLSIRCATEGALIYYAIGEDADPTTLYEAPITITDNRPVKAVARKEGYTDSPIAIFADIHIACQPAVLDKYDGKYFTLSSGEGAKIYYTLDGTTPTTESSEYTGRTAITELCTLKTLAVHSWMENSEVKTYELDYYFDGDVATVTSEGQLQKSMEWSEANEVTSLTVKGPINSSDLIYIKKKLPSLKHLNLEHAVLEGHSLPDEAFAGMQLITFTSSNGISNVGNRIFAECPQLAAVIWNASEKLPANTFGERINPNMLVYVVNKLLAPSGVRNIVVNGTASEIVLSDAEANNNFFCPVEFKANRISYTHNYSMETEPGACMGWETLALPFTVEKIVHYSKGELIPFKSFVEKGSPESERPFWIRRLTDNGFEDVEEIEGNTPYIISMPNSSEYASRYNVAGNVTFSAENATVLSSEELVSGKKGGVSLVPTFVQQPQNNNVWAINRDSIYEGYAPGSLFVPSLRQVRPFEAYATTSVVGNARPILIAKMGDFETTGIHELLIKRTPDSDEEVEVFSLSGQLVARGVLQNLMKRLPTGVYIVGGKKVVVRK